MPELASQSADNLAPAAATFSYLRGLDGIRALAVLGVLGYHAGISWMGGGLLGLDVFFALSGFLITSLLVAEYKRSGSISLRHFYARRARRLLPALLLLLLLVAVFAAYFAERDTLSTLRGDALSTLLYVANWRFVLDGSNYFVQSGPVSPLLHMWSLAVEEQFYIVWPLTVLILLRKKGLKAVALVAILLTVASSAECAAVFHVGASETRLYFGTDTHGQSLMLGAFLGALVALLRRSQGEPAEGHSRRASILMGLVGTAGLVYTLWAINAVQSGSSFLFQGGFLAMALATGAMIVVVVHQPRAAISRILSFGPLVYIGRISYGLYLYHYPLFQMIDETHTGLLGWHLLTARLAATGAMSVASFHLVEQPIRQRRFLPGWRLRVVTPVAIGSTVTALFVSTSGSVVAFGSVLNQVPPTSKNAAVSCSYVRPGVPCATPAAAIKAGLSPHNKVRVLMLGDSIGLTLSGGLMFQDGRWDVSINVQGAIGCDLDPKSTVNIQGNITNAAQGCKDWPRTWAELIKNYDPDVVAIELGRWEVSNRIIDGKWSTIGAAAWDHVLSKLFDQAIGVLSKRGAKVVFFTLPYIQQTTEQPNGLPWDINTAVRTNAYNSLLQRTVAGKATVIDLNRMLDPKGVYTSYIDGIRVRNVDDEHLSLAGGIYVRPMILPELLALGLPHAIASQRAR